MQCRKNIVWFSAAVCVGIASTPTWGQAPSRGQRPQGSQRGGFTFDRLLERHDKNQDGKVTRQEWQGPEQFFGQMDQNGDGVITKEEFEARMRNQRGFGRPGEPAVEIKGPSVVKGQKAGIEGGQYAPDFELQPVQPYPSLRRWLGDEAPQSIENGVKLSQLVGNAPIMLFFGSFT